jgi:tetrathionate reductase subunit B
MLIQADACIGCDVCLKACKDEFVGNDYSPYSAAQPNTAYGYGPNHTFGWPNTPSQASAWVAPGQNWLDVSEQVSGTFPDVKVRYLPLPCMQCDNAPCVVASRVVVCSGQDLDLQDQCSLDAVYTRLDGIVLIDPQKSVNQPHLPASCPYGRIYWNAQASIAQKCTFCAHLIDEGKNPRCVEACPISAIVFGDLENPDSDISRRIQSLNAQPLHPEYGTKPKVYYSGLI